MTKEQRSTTRVFKAKRFARDARKSGLTDAALCEAIREVMRGQAVDLGGGVWKKRLEENRQRSIVLARGGRYWIYEHLFAKADKDNISSKELEALRLLAKGYEAMQPAQIGKLLESGQLTEICT